MKVRTAVVAAAMTVAGIGPAMAGTTVTTDASCVAVFDGAPGECTVPLPEGDSAVELRTLTGPVASWTVVLRFADGREFASFGCHVQAFSSACSGSGSGTSTEGAQEVGGTYARVFVQLGDEYVIARTPEGGTATLTLDEGPGATALTVTPR